MTLPTIDYQRLLSARDWYDARGYRFIEVPWLVPDEAYHVTSPTDRKWLQTPLGNVIASGEQSFIHLLQTGKLKTHVQDTQFQTLTPCFRDEPVLDDLHQTHFVKVELINLDVNCLFTVIHDAQDFFSRFINTKIVQTSARSWDIVTSEHEIELGSYGVRFCAAGSFIYGTGLAEPRLSVALRGVRSQTVDL